MKNRLIYLIAVSLVVGTGCEKVKYADKYGFLPENDPLANAEAFQKCLDGGGKIRVRKPGTYAVSRTLFVDSDTDLNFDEGVTLKKAV